MATKDISVIRDRKTGNLKDIRDRKLKTAKAKSAVAQTDAIRMKTTDNKEVYIDRNSFVQAMAEVLNSNSQSTISTLFGADANGNHANINMSNLASVLSASNNFYTAFLVPVEGEDWLEPVKRWYYTLPEKCLAAAIITHGYLTCIYGYKGNNNYGGFMRITYGSWIKIVIEGGVWSVIAV